MNEHQRKALDAPIGEGLPPPSLTYFHHHEFYGKVPLGVQVTVDAGPGEEERYGRPVWHCSVSVWPRTPGPYPLPPGSWKRKHRDAAEAVARKNLAGVGDPGGEVSFEVGGMVLHARLPLSADEWARLGVAEN